MSSGALAGGNRCRLCDAALTSEYALVPAVGRHEPSRFSVERCVGCGLLQTTPLPTADDLREIYEASSYTWQPPQGLVGKLEAIYRRMLVDVDQVRVIADASARAGGRDVLDIGCGDGLIVAEARRAGLIAFGVDYPGTPRWAECELEWKESADLETLSQPAERWDVISMFHVLEHLRDPVEMLRRLHGWLRPSGRLVLQVPNAGSIQARWFGPRWYGVDVPRHLLHFTPATLARLVGEAGFVVERVRHVSWRDNGPLLASSLLPGLDPRVERERATVRSGAQAALAKLLYFAVAWGSLPVVLLEAMLGRGGTVTVIARKGQFGVLNVEV